MIIQISKNVLSVFNVKSIIIFTFLIVLSSAICTVLPYIFGLLINSIVSGTRFYVILLTFFICSLISIFLIKINSFGITRISKQIQLELQKLSLKKIASYSPSKLECFKNGELGMKFFRDIQNITDAFRSFYPQFIEFFCGILFSLGFAFYTNWLIGIIFIVLFPTTFLLLRPYAKKFDKVNALFRISSDNSFCRIFEVFYSLPFFKSISSEKFYLIESQRKLANLAKISCKCSFYDADFNFRINLILVVGRFSILSASVLLMYKGILTIGDVIFYQLLFLSMFSSVSNIYKTLPILALIKASMISLNELDAIVPEKINFGRFKFHGNVELKNVTFSYGLAFNPIIKDLAISIRSGDFISIQGGNGSGKTTLLKILCGYLHPNKGKVLFDGIDSSEVNLKSLRKNISIVDQEFLLISDTIKNNITLHNNRYTLDDINNVIKVTGLESLIQNLPHGLNEIVGNNGKKLSGGEIQKIAIARALIRKPKLIVFDEITNHLDKDSLNLILKLISSLKGKVTILFVSHEKHLNLEFDKVIYLNNDFKKNKV